MPKKLIRVLAIVFVLSLFLSGTVLAQVSPPVRDPGGGGGGISKPIKTADEIIQTIKVPKIRQVVEAQKEEKENNKVSSDSYTTDSFQAIIAQAVLDMTIGSLGTNSSGEAEFNAGVFPATSGLIAGMYSNPPASAQSYVAYVMNSAGIAQPAYAQGAGLGFSSLTPILSAWVVFRNIAYFFFVAIFVVIGFMIMFRQKISGQAAITAQQAIPNIIIALIAVTFSYAIAGLLIELMYIIMFLIVGIFSRDQSVFLNGNVFQIGGTIITSNFTAVAENVGAFINDSLGGGIVSNVVGIVGGLTVALVFAATIVVCIFRLLFTLLKRYVSVIASVVLAPIILMMGAIPGQNTFGPWLKGIIGNLAAFPALLIALVISDVITGNFSGNTQAVQYGGFLPPYLGGAGTSGTAAFLIGVGILLVLPDLVDKVSQLAGAGKGPLDELIGAAKKNVLAGVQTAPVYTGALGGALGTMGAAADLYRKGVTSPREIWRGVVKGEGVRPGAGLFPGVQRGFNVGQPVRKYTERLIEGRLLQAEDIETMLARQLRGEKKKEETTPTLPGSRP